MRIQYLPHGYSQQRQREKKKKIYPVLMAMEAEWYRKRRHKVYWNTSQNIKGSVFDKTITEAEGLPFLDLPHPDREFTRWWEYQDNGNFKYKPATYIQSARDCWWRKCVFCEWAKKYPKYECRPIEDVIDEIEECKALGFKEVFDDSGTFPNGEWLNEFLRQLAPFHKNLRFSANLRLGDWPFRDMRMSGFRMVLFGLESASQETLDKINKGIKVEDYKYIIKAAKAGLEPHVTVMFGYPWETDEDAMNTLKLVWWLLKKGYAKTAQASYYTVDSNLGNRDHHKYVNKIYDVAKSPIFWFNKIRGIHNVADLKYFWLSIKTGIKERILK